jgi:lipopolysaccharide transport protein LptA
LLESKNLEAQGEVRVILKSGGEANISVGFFAEERPVFIDADEMRYSDDNKRFLFKGNVKVWQGKDMLETAELTLFRSSGKITCRERVRTRLTFRPESPEDAEPDEEAQEKQIDITARSMDFDPEIQRLVYRQKVTLKVEDIQLDAASLFLDTDETETELKTLTARENVRIERGDYQGFGQEAVYDVGQEFIVLTGKPVLIDKNRGKVEGRKLTFHIADDKIIVENEDRERSETVIKS